MDSTIINISEWNCVTVVTTEHGGNEKLKTKRCIKLQHVSAKLQKVWVIPPSDRKTRWLCWKWRSSFTTHARCTRFYTVNLPLSVNTSDKQTNSVCCRITDVLFDVFVLFRWLIKKHTFLQCYRWKCAETTWVGFPHCLVSFSFLPCAFWLHPCTIYEDNWNISIYS